MEQPEQVCFTCSGRFCVFLCRVCQSQSEIPYLLPARVWCTAASVSVLPANSPN